MSVFEEKKLNELEGKKENKKHTVMIVDDEKAYIGTMESLLSKHYNVISALSGEEALDIINQLKDTKEISVIISDQRMGNGMRGIELLQKVKEIIPDTIRVVLTGYEDKEVMLAAIQEAKVYDFLLKPIEPQELRHRVKQCIGVIEDKQRIKEYQAQLAQAEKMAVLGTLILGMEDEINNPVNNAYANLQQIPEKLRELKSIVARFPVKKEYEETHTIFNEQMNTVNESLSNLKVELLRISEVLHKLGAFIQISTDEKKEINVNEVLVGIVNSIKEKYKNSIEIVTDFQVESKMEGDFLAIKSAFYNILEYSCEMIEERKRIEKDGCWKGRLIISLDEEDEKAVLRFRDNGIGLNHEEKEKLFDPFFSIKNVGQGMNLGLLLISEIFKSQKLKIEVASKPREGTTFKMHLPLIKKTQLSQKGEKYVAGNYEKKEQTNIDSTHHSCSR